MDQPSKARRPKVTRAITPECDNHPGREATFQTTSGGRHNLIRLCATCVPKHWRQP